MGMVKGDTARFQRERRKKLAKRVQMRALRASLAAAAKGAPAPANRPAPPAAK